MKFCSSITLALVLVGGLGAVSAGASTDIKTSTFAVWRNDDRIGTNTISVARNGAQTTVEIVTHVKVSFAFVTVYRFDQTETEQWASGRLQSLNATTDDNGAIRTTSVSSSGNAMLVHANGQPTTIAVPIVPASLWNAALLTQAQALDPKDGSIVPVKVADRGEENLVVEGRSVRARHYAITTKFTQDVWYDESFRLVKVELKAPDGSTIRYQLV